VTAQLVRATPADQRNALDALLSGAAAFRGKRPADTPPSAARYASMGAVRGCERQRADWLAGCRSKAVRAADTGSMLRFAHPPAGAAGAAAAAGETEGEGEAAGAPRARPGADPAAAIEIADWCACSCAAAPPAQLWELSGGGVAAASRPCGPRRARSWPA
jgi:hypothetical protein